MSTSGLILMILVWSYVTIFLVYSFSKLLRKEREKKQTKEDLPED